MIIKCPQCATGYNVPEKVLGDKPKKMRCTKCKSAFTVTRRSKSPPSGYVEYTGAQQLPPEFAFLQAERKGEKLEIEPRQKSAEAVQVDSGEDTFTGPAPAGPVSAASVQQEPEQEDEPVPETEPGTSEVEAGQKVAGGSTPVGKSMPAETMFGGNSSAWEIEAPLELGTYAIEEETVGGNQAMGKFFFALSVLVVVFFIFVAARNGWNLALTNLPGQVAFAFSGKPAENLPDEVEGIDAVVVGPKKVVVSENGISYLVVSGEVINNNASSRSHIIIRGRLYDASGDLRREARMPCGKAIEEDAIRRTPKGAVQGHFHPDGKLYNCSLLSNGSTIFQIIFEELPEDYDASFEVEATAVAATGG